MATQLTLWDEPGKTQATASAASLLASVTLGKPIQAERVPAAPIPKFDTLSTLQHQIQRIETSHRPHRERITTGIAALDEMLPHRGYLQGSLIEWIALGQASGSGWLSWLGAKSAHEQSGGKIVVLDCDRTFYPPAVLACGIPADALVVLRPQTAADVMWSLDQSLRCDAVAAVCARVPRLTSSDARRLQLAAESGGTLGMLHRSPSVTSEPSLAEVRWQVGGLIPEHSSTTYRADRLVSVRLLRVRGTQAGQSVVLQIDQQSRIVRKEPVHGSQNAQRLAAELAHPKIAGRQRQRQQPTPALPPARTA